MNPKTVVILGILATFSEYTQGILAGSKHISSLYDSKLHQFQNNTVYFEELNKAFTNNALFKFTEFKAGFNHFTKHPTLMVYQPDENKKELHGYYLPKGLLSLLSYSKVYPFYAPIREYFMNSTTEAVTPYAAKYAYAYFYEYQLSAIIGNNVSPTFAVLFIAPKSRRKEGINDYEEVVKYFNKEGTADIEIKIL